MKTKENEDTLNYINKVLQVPELVKNTNENTSSIADRIKDKSKVELNKQTLRYIYNIKGVVEK